MPRLSDGQRERAIGMIEMAASHAHVARTPGYSRVSVTNLMQRFRQTGQTSNRPRSGRPRVTTHNKDRCLHIIHLRNRFLTVTSSAISAFVHRVSRRTISWRLRAHGLSAYRPLRVYRYWQQNIVVGDWHGSELYDTCSNVTGKGLS
ncbi:hypothetical protein BaRGS_00025407 [Batillaria attramentaria]|uniref:Transposase Tc1-like domain-containing protein n=1 Tax=Batillaria attramentaria TaxID=370345 RepID=A0ABD0K8H5_9CAEN